jgi:hypothetical protein
MPGRPRGAVTSPSGGWLIVTGQTVALNAVRPWRRHPPTRMPHCGVGLVTMPRRIRGGALDARITTPAVRAGSSTTRRFNGCRARRACACRNVAVQTAFPRPEPRRRRALVPTVVPTLDLWARNPRYPLTPRTAGLDDPAGQHVESVHPIRDEIERCVRTLSDELGVPAGTWGMPSSVRCGRDRTVPRYRSLPR